MTYVAGVWRARPVYSPVSVITMHCNLRVSLTGASGLACYMSNQFIHLSVLSRCTAVCVLVCQVQIDCMSILMYIVALDRIYRHLGISQDIGGGTVISGRDGDLG